MSSDGFFSTFAAVANVLFVLIAIFIYSSLIRQISVRSTTPLDVEQKNFGLADAIVAILLSGLFLANIVVSFSNPHDVTSTRMQDLLAGALLTIGILLFLIAFLRLRGFHLSALAGLAKLSFGRVLSTGTILLFAAYPLIYIADALTRRLLGEGLSKQEIIQLFNASQTLPQRITIIVMAVALAPMAEEFMFRFFLYGVLKRYFGRFVGLIVNASLFAAVHTHLPSFGPLFVLGSCFTIAYEWSGSILVPMTMHALFNALTLTLLAFPQTLPQ
jgi:membrane protease YdiL (CAAX protease family)